MRTFVYSALPRLSRAIIKAERFASENDFSAACCLLGTTSMIRHPIESNFYVNVSEADVEVTFAPTRSRYTYSRLVEADLGLLSPNPLVRHAGRNGDTGDYEPQEVQAMAYRVALATARRLRKSAKPTAAGRK
jgi:hypothetical protein